MEDKLISIIIPVYNIEKELEASIDSILKQTYKKIEIILVNDGSTDKSLEKCVFLATLDNRIKVINQPNQGVSQARNAGIKAANGYYICFIDGDDWVHPALIERLSTIIENCELAVCNYTNEETETYKLNNKPDILDTTMALKILPQNEKISYSACAKLFVAKKVKEIFFDCNTGILEDYLFVCKYISQIDRVACIEDKLYVYKQRIGSAMHKTYNHKRLDMLYSYRKSFEIINHKQPQLLGLYYSSYLFDLIRLRLLIRNPKKFVDDIKIIDNEIINIMNNSIIKLSNSEKIKVAFYRFLPNLYLLLLRTYKRINDKRKRLILMHNKLIKS